MLKIEFPQGFQSHTWFGLLQLFLIYLTWVFRFLGYKQDLVSFEGNWLLWVWSVNTNCIATTIQIGTAILISSALRFFLQVMSSLRVLMEITGHSRKKARLNLHYNVQGYTFTLSDSFTPMFQFLDYLLFLFS